MVIGDPSHEGAGTRAQANPTGFDRATSGHANGTGGVRSTGHEIRKNLLAAGVPLLNGGVPPDPTKIRRVEMPIGMAVSSLIGELNRLPADAVFAEASGDADMTAVFYTDLPSGRSSKRSEAVPAAGNRETERRTDERRRNGGRPHGEKGQVHQ